MAQAGTGGALLPLPHQQGIGLGMGQAPPMGTAGNHGVYDGFHPGAGLAGNGLGHQRLYYWWINVLVSAFKWVVYRIDLHDNGTLFATQSIL